jgi:ribosomal protein S17
VVVKAVQDVKGTVVSTAMQNTVVVRLEAWASRSHHTRRVDAIDNVQT